MDPVWLIAASSALSLFAAIMIWDALSPNQAREAATSLEPDSPLTALRSDADVAR